jgi:putative hydrolase of the HAD superfamily
MALPVTDGLSHVGVWIFDLDNTLYPASCNLFAQVSRRMTAFIADRFDLPLDEAVRMQKHYFHTHGTTLRGLMVENGVDPAAFLDYVHRIDLSGVPACPALDAALTALAGRKIIYTNGSVRHALAITEHLGIARHFDLIHDIVAAEYVPKPDPRPYAALLRRAAIDPARACMVEDIARNLVPAAALGMTTVWVRGDAAWSRPDGMDPAAIHHVTDDLPAWLSGVVAARRHQRASPARPADSGD